MNYSIKKAPPSGSWLVMGVVAIGLLTVGWSWVSYHANNPTSSQATLRSENGGWIVRARFSENQQSRLVVGTAAVMTSSALLDHKMSGLIAQVEPDGWTTIAVTTGPPAGTPDQEIPCSVTVDAATAPVDE
jgi:multidrug resistance efflux pump